VLDVEFEPEHLPEIYNAVVISTRGNGAASIRLTAEVQQHIGRNQGARRRADVDRRVGARMRLVDTGNPITSRLGQAALGRILNVLGEPVDEATRSPPDAERWPIHRETRSSSTGAQTEVFETGSSHRPDRPVREGR